MMPWAPNWAMLIAVAACQHDPAPLSADAPRPHNEPSTKSNAPAPSSARWLRWDELATWPVVSTFDSAGHGLDHPPARVRVPPAAQEAYLNWSLGNTWPVGITLVQELPAAQAGFVGPARSRQGVDTVLYVMERSDTGWRYLVVSGDGSIEYDSAAPSQTNDATTSTSRGTPAQQPRCGACHTQATSDGVFGPPRDDEVAAPKH